MTAVLGDAEFGESATLRRTLHRAQLAYARRVAPRTWLAAGVGGGLLVGFMATPRVITDDDVFAFIELVAATAVLQWEIGSRLEAEGGVRAAWMYHPSNEAESIFAGAQAAALWRVGLLQLGPRLYLGRIAEENGSGRAVVGGVPLIARVVWSW